MVRKAETPLAGLARLETVELALDRKLCVDDSTFRTRTPGQQLRQAMIGLRADNEIDERRTLHQELAFRLGHATGNGQDHVAVTAVASRFPQPSQAAQLRIDLLGRLLADMAGIEHHEIGIRRGLDHAVAVSRQGVRHTIGVVDVHLAAVGLDEEVLRHVVAVSRIPIAAEMSAAGRRSSLAARGAADDGVPSGDVPRIDRSTSQAT